MHLGSHYLSLCVHVHCICKAYIASARRTLCLALIFISLMYLPYLALIFKYLAFYCMYTHVHVSGFLFANEFMG